MHNERAPSGAQRRLARRSGRYGVCV